MTELTFGIALGVLATILGAVIVRIRSLHRQLDALRTEVALARVENVLSSQLGDDSSPGRRARHLELITGRSTGPSRLRHRRTSGASAVTTAALAATGVVILEAERRTDPTCPGSAWAAAVPPWHGPSSGSGTGR
ncbi:hypothetical protein ACIBCM_27290 [Streptomyces sp. NPDC051018]|uniref:hypothetical protein n=1 Tax=Streptomyces sp. NPDC051018 TaxID=3365639 RepID=UPI0037B1D1DB